MFVRLIYTSQETGPVDTTVITSILESSRDYNLAHNITGLLCYGNARFIQHLEGDRDSVNALYSRIMLDTRHKNIVLLDYAALEDRMFENWTMGFVSMENPDTAKLLKKTTQMDAFEPEKMRGWQATSFMQVAKEQLFPQIELPRPEKAGIDKSFH